MEIRDPGPIRCGQTLLAVVLDRDGLGTRVPALGGEGESDPASDADEDREPVPERVGGMGRSIPRP